MKLAPMQATKTLLSLRTTKVLLGFCASVFIAASATADSTPLDNTLLASLTPSENSLNQPQTTSAYPQAIEAGLPNGWDAFGTNSNSSSFSLSIKDHTTTLSTISLFVNPGESTLIKAVLPQYQADYQFHFEAGSTVQLGANKWVWSAPQESGLVRLIVKEANNSIEQRVINAFVMVPHDQIRNGKLEGYRIGQYPKEAKDGNPQYLPPKGFIRVTKDNENTQLTPHFKLKQFLCKQADGYPKFVVLQEKLLYKLEHIVSAAKADGFPVDTLHVMSGYRTPFYNKSIGNVKYSRHQWGDAADVFIDLQPSAGVMDDLNNDRKHDVKDAKVMASWVNGMSRQAWYKPYVGGLGIYKPNSRRGSFIHVDVRGSLARW